MTTLATTTTAQLVINTPKYYNKFRQIQYLLIRVTLPYICILASVGFITNTATIVLLSKNFVTKNTRHKWTLIALGKIIHIEKYFRLFSKGESKNKCQYVCYFPFSLIKDIYKDRNNLIYFMRCPHTLLLYERSGEKSLIKKKRNEVNMI